MGSARTLAGSNALEAICWTEGRERSCEDRPGGLHVGFEPFLERSEIQWTTPGGQRGSKELRLRREGKALKEKPQERYRYETRPNGFGRSKPLGGRETLQGERTGLGKPGSSGLPIPEALKGTKSHERDIALPFPMYVGRCASKAGYGQNCSGLAPDGFRTAGEASLTVCNYLESVIRGKGDLVGMLSVGEVKPTRGCSRFCPIPRREGHRNTSGSG